MRAGQCVSESVTCLWYEGSAVFFVAKTEANEQTSWWVSLLMNICHIRGAAYALAAFQSLEDYNLTKQEKAIILRRVLCKLLWE